MEWDHNMKRIFRKYLRHGCCLIGWCHFMLFPLSSSASDSSVCAEVKIEIQQELTLERQAFDAHMRINNGLDQISIENVRVEVTFWTGRGRRCGRRPILKMRQRSFSFALIHCIASRAWTARGASRRLPRRTSTG